MLQKTVDIEGLETFENIELLDDTPPDATRVWFDVVNEEMPFLSQQEGRVIRKPFVHRFIEMELGRMKSDRRIRDEVVLDETTGKWKVVAINRNPKQSDILKYKDAWNAFARGQTFESMGTPLSTIFRSDPAKVDRYRYFHISTVEQLASIPEVQIQELGMGAREDVNKAKTFLAKASDVGAVSSINRQLEDERAKRISLEEMVQDLQAKLTEVLSQQLEFAQPTPSARRGRKPKTETNQLEAA